MAHQGLPPSSPCIHLPEWREAYQAVLKETDTFVLFTRVEVAQATMLTRREALLASPDQHPERQAVEAALTNLRVIKREHLGFDDGSGPEIFGRERKGEVATIPETE